MKTKRELQEAQEQLQRYIDFLEWLFEEDEMKHSTFTEKWEEFEDWEKDNTN